MEHAAEIVVLTDDEMATIVGAGGPAQPIIDFVNSLGLPVPKVS